MKEASSRKAPQPAQVKLSTAGGQPLYRKLIDHLLDEIRTRALQPGDRMRSERELMRELGLSYPTVTRALRELVHAGVLERRQGKGTFVRALPDADGAAAPAPARGGRKRSGELVLQGNWPPLERAVLERALDRFRARHGGVRVRIVASSVEEEPAGDLFRTIGNRCWKIAPLAEPLDARLAALPERERPHPAAGDLFRHAGRTWGVARVFAPCVLYYRRDLFRNAGLSEPAAHWTWDDLYAAAEALTEPRAGRLGLVLAPSLVHAIAFVWQAGGRLWDERSRQGLLDDPATAAGLEKYRALYQLAPPELRLTSAYGGIWESFAEGRAAMVIWGGYAAMALRHAGRLREGAEWAVSTVPHGPARAEGVPAAAGGPTIFYSDGLCLARHAADDPRAWDLFRELTGPQAAEDLAQAGYRLTGLASAWEDDAITAAFRRGIPAGRMTLEAHRPELFGTADAALSAFFSLEGDASALLHAACDAVTRRLAQSGDPGV